MNHRAGQPAYPYTEWKQRGACSQADGTACLHGTFVAGFVCRRIDRPGDSPTADCWYVHLRGDFSGQRRDAERRPKASPTIRLLGGCSNAERSAALAHPSTTDERIGGCGAWPGGVIMLAAGNQERGYCHHPPSVGGSL